MRWAWIGKGEYSHAKMLLHLLEENSYNMSETKNTIENMLAEYGL
jgi:hypothetical protein